MKTEWSKQWLASKQPRKQRKYIYNIPLHLARKLVSAILSKDLRKKYGCRNISLRKGDVVKIMRGEFKSKTGKIERLRLNKGCVYIEGITVTKKNGTKVMRPINASNVIITELYSDDKKRIQRLKK